MRKRSSFYVLVIVIKLYHTSNRYLTVGSLVAIALIFINCLYYNSCMSFCPVFQACSFRNSDMSIYPAARAHVCPTCLSHVSSTQVFPSVLQRRNVHLSCELGMSIYPATRGCPIDQQLRCMCLAGDSP